MYGPAVGMDSRQVVSILDVSIERKQATAVSRLGPTVTISLDVMPSGVLYYPQVGEQWVVERSMGTFLLVYKVLFQDLRQATNCDVGDTLVYGKRVVTVGEETAINTPSLTVNGQQVLSSFTQIPFTYGVADVPTYVTLGEPTFSSTLFTPTTGGVQCVPRVYDVRLTYSSTVTTTLLCDEEQVLYLAAPHCSRILKPQSSIQVQVQAPQSGTGLLEVVAMLI